MSCLIQGMESERKVRALIKLTSISSKPKQQALVDHLSNNDSRDLAAALNNVKQGNFSTCLNTLNETMAIVEEVKEEDWAKFKENNQQEIKQ